MPLNPFERGKESDILLYNLALTLTGLPSMGVMLGMHHESVGLRVIETDSTGRLLVNPATRRLTTVNQILTDTDTNVLTGSPVFRRITFYAFNAGANLKFLLDDGTVTGYVTAVPSVPLIVEGIYVGCVAKNQNVGVPATLQAVVGFDPLEGGI